MPGSLCSWRIYIYIYIPHINPPKVVLIKNEYLCFIHRRAYSRGFYLWHPSYVSRDKTIHTCESSRSPVMLHIKVMNGACLAQTGELNFCVRWSKSPFKWLNCYPPREKGVREPGSSFVAVQTQRSGLAPLQTGRHRRPLQLQLLISSSSGWSVCLTAWVEVNGKLCIKAAQRLCARTSFVVM